jgi:hypothetical protein
MMNTVQFVETLADMSFTDAFNPYSESCDDFDHDDAPAIRRQNLKLVLDAAIERKVDSIWIARDLGYRGGRRTGLALTDEAHQTDHSVLYGDLPLVRATKGPLWLSAPPVLSGKHSIASNARFFSGTCSRSTRMNTVIRNQIAAIHVLNETLAAHC